MLKTFQSLTIILFLFGISFLPLTQITEAEAQFSDKIQKPTHPSEAIKKPIEINKAQNFKKIQKIPTPSASSIKKPKPGTLTEKQKKKLLGKMPALNDAPMEQLIREINISVADEYRIAREVTYLADQLINHTSSDNPYRRGASMTLRDMVQEQIGCDAPIMYGNRDGLCGTVDTFFDMLLTSWEAPFILSYRTHKQLSFCGVNDDIILDLTGDSVDDVNRNGDRIIGETPLSVTLRSMGTDFGKCFCKFGSRQGTHPRAGYENIVPDNFSDVCPL